MGAACVVTQGGRCIIRKPWGLVSHSAVAVSRLSNFLTDRAPQTLWLVLPDIGIPGAVLSGGQNWGVLEQPTTTLPHPKHSSVDGETRGLLSTLARQNL